MSKIQSATLLLLQRDPMLAQLKCAGERGEETQLSNPWQWVPLHVVSQI